MATLPAHEFDAPMVPVEQYLTTVYEPDCEYIDGRVEERNVGEHDHGYLQALFAMIFLNHRADWGVRAVTDVRTQVRPSNFRVPDVSILRADAPKEHIITHPQLIAIEILSPEDRWSRLQEKIDDYLAFGVENIWIIDPETRSGWKADRTGTHPVRDGELSVPGTPIRVALTDLFAELDR